MRWTRRTAAGTILFDLKKRDWSPEILAVLKIPVDWMPPTFEGPEFTGVITREAADSTGLKAGTTGGCRGGDQAAQAVGVGAVEPGHHRLDGWYQRGGVCAPTPSALIEPEGRLHAFCHAVPGMWHFMGVMLSAAGSLQWYRDTLAPQVSFEELMDSAAGVEGRVRRTAVLPVSLRGTHSVPRPAGERCFHWPDYTAYAGTYDSLRS